MKRFFYPALCVLLAACVSNDPEVIEPSTPKLLSVNVSGAVAMVASLKGLIKIGENRVTSPVTYTFENEAVLDRNLNLVDIDSTWFMIVSKELQQMYFVEKKTGKATQTKFFPIDYLNAGKIAIYEDVCYFVDVNRKLYKMTEFLSMNAVYEEMPQTEVSSIAVDQDGTFYLWAGSKKIMFQDDQSVNVPAHAGFWRHFDGHYRMIDTEGKIYKYNGTTPAYVKSIPYSVSNIGARNFPDHSTSIGFQYKYDLFMFFGLDAPFNQKNFQPPTMTAEEKPFLEVRNTGFGKYYYLMYGLSGQPHKVRKVDITDFSSSVIEIDGIYRITLFQALSDDMIIMTVCEGTGGCQEKFAFLNHDGTLDFSLTAAPISGRIVTF